MDATSHLRAAAIVVTTGALIGVKSSSIFIKLLLPQNPNTGDRTLSIRIRRMMHVQVAIFVMEANFIGNDRTVRE